MEPNSYVECEICIFEEFLLVNFIIQFDNVVRVEIVHPLWKDKLNVTAILNT